MNADSFIRFTYIIIKLLGSFVIDSWILRKATMS